MIRHEVILVLKNGATLKFPHSSGESGAETVKAFYDAPGPLRPVTQWGVVHQDAVALLYCCKIEEKDETAKEALGKITSVEQMIRDFFRR